MTPLKHLALLPFNMQKNLVCEITSKIILRRYLTKILLTKSTPEKKNHSTCKPESTTNEGRDEPCCLYTDSFPQLITNKNTLIFWNHLDMKSKVFQTRHLFCNLFYSLTISDEGRLNPSLKKFNFTTLWFLIVGDNRSPGLHCLCSSPFLGLKELLYPVGTQELLGHFLFSFTGSEKHQRQEQCEETEVGPCMDEHHQSWVNFVTVCYCVLVKSHHLKPA